MEYLLYVEHTLKPFQFVNFVDAAEMLVGATADAGWKLIAACSAVTGDAFPGTITHVWEVPTADSLLGKEDQPYSAFYLELLRYCEEPKQKILALLPYSDHEVRLPRDDERIHYFLSAEISLQEGKNDLFNEKATALVETVKGLGWTLVVARFTAPSRVFHLWELTNADALLDAMRVFGDTRPYAELLECCTQHTQQLFTAMPYNPSGANPSE
jgi:hypothetical protein